MSTLTLRAFLQAHEHARFLWRGEIVRCQRLTDHYHAYLRASVEVEGNEVRFTSVTQRSHLPAFTVLSEDDEDRRLEESIANFKIAHIIRNLGS